MVFLSHLSFIYYVQSSVKSGDTVMSTTHQERWKLKKPKDIFLPVYSWPWNNTVWTKMKIFFNMVGPPYPWDLHPWIQPTANQKQWFWSSPGSLWMRRANCMHYSMSLYIRNLSIYEFWYPKEILESMPQGFWSATIVKFSGNQKLYVNFRVHRGQSP